MASRVRKAVDDGEVFLASPEHEIFAVFFRLVSIVAEETARLRLRERADIFHPPGRPEVGLAFGTFGRFVHEADYIIPAS